MFRKQRKVTVFKSFKVSSKARDVMATKGKLICSYPGPSIEVPNSIFNDDNFLSKLANFLVHINNNNLWDAATTMQKKSSSAPQVQDMAHPCYITELLTGISRSIGCSAEVVCVSKYVGNVI